MRRSSGMPMGCSSLPRDRQVWLAHWLTKTKLTSQPWRYKHEFTLWPRVQTVCFVCNWYFEMSVKCCHNVVSKASLIITLTVDSVKTPFCWYAYSLYNYLSSFKALLNWWIAKYSVSAGVISSHLYFSTPTDFLKGNKALRWKQVIQQAVTGSQTKISSLALLHVKAEN